MANKQKLLGEVSHTLENLPYHLGVMGTYIPLMSSTDELNPYDLICLEGFEECVLIVASEAEEEYDIGEKLPGYKYFLFLFEYGLEVDIDYLPSKYLTKGTKIYSVNPRPFLDRDRVN